MSTGALLLIAAGGGLGAAARFLVDRAVTRRARSGVPWGILLVNATGALAAGFLLGLAQSAVLDAPWPAILTAGLLGGYTTFSTAMVDTVRLLERRRWRAALLNGGGMLVATVGLAALGVALGGSL